MSSKAAATAAVLLVLCTVRSALPPGAAAEQASEPAAGRIDAGAYHTCALLVDGRVRCWGFNGDGQLGYVNPDSVGDNETPGSVGPVNLGVGRSVKAIAAGDFHTCALLDDASVRCWGFGGDGRLGYGNTNGVADPSSVGAVDLGRPAIAITAGTAHTCALLDDGTVRCWGYGGGGVRSDGRLGYANNSNVGDTDTPASAGPVKLGGSAVAISAGVAHTCALLTDGQVRCWGRNGSGQLGYGNTNPIGDDETPDKAGPVNFGPGATTVAISSGGTHTCALLAGGSVRCWGFGGDGRLGYGNTSTVGDKPTTTPDKVGPVDLGSGATVRAISAGDAHTCAVLTGGSVRCWGFAANGRLGYPTLDDLGNQNSVGDDETPGSVAPVDVGAGRTATAISAGRQHTCARLDDASVRCWGYGANGRLGYCNENSIGDDETPGSVGPVDLREPGGSGAGCPSSASAGGSASTGAAPTAVGNKIPVMGSDATRARGLRSCLGGVASHAEREKRIARRGLARRRARARRHLSRHARDGRRRCLRLYGRTPGRVTGLRAHALGKTQVELSFSAPGTDESHPPAARTYVVKQSPRPIRGARDFARARTLCKGACRFTVTRVGDKVSLTVTDLRPRATYYYALVARDNVSSRRGPRSPAAKVRTG